ncbi:hypothetical protein [Leptobacterium sp. I13]|uniref:hypothetical protein n=1 Tax=Leptobacterium meishanense TaxID=3128904 RepID=UPI0030EE386B
MDELELLKKDWQKRNTDFPKLSYDELYKMIWKRSSSIVKWIFYISIIEFAFWSILAFFTNDMDHLRKFNSYHIDYITIPMNIIGYAVLLYFIVQFYFNYRKITVTDNTKVLMNNILKTRRTVKQYVWFNIIFFFVSFIVIAIVLLYYDQDLINSVEEAAHKDTTGLFYFSYIGIMVIAASIIACIIWFLYRLIYGVLIQKLKKNYDELEKIEV